MLIRLDQIGDTPFQWDEKVALEADSLARPELVELSEIRWRGTVTRQVEGFLLRAEISYDQTLSCARCLQPIHSAVNEELELVLLVRAAEPVTGEHELEEEDLKVLFLPDDEVDTGPIVREQVDLAIPMRALCREDCLGLCPVCGGDRNLAPCDCAERAVDPRWSALESLRSRE